MFGQGKKTLKLVQKYNTIADLGIFTKENSTKIENIAAVGEHFFIRLYGAQKMDTLDRYRYTTYNRSIRHTSLSTAFKLESLPPTSSASKQHSYRTYHTLQQWLGNDLSPTEWGWHLQDDCLVITGSENPIAPDRLLKLISCGCKTGCGRQCDCRKLGLQFVRRCAANVVDSHVRTVQRLR